MRSRFARDRSTLSSLVEPGRYHLSHGSMVVVSTLTRRRGRKHRFERRSTHLASDPADLRSPIEAPCKHR